MQSKNLYVCKKITAYMHTLPRYMHRHLSRLLLLGGMAAMLMTACTNNKAAVPASAMSDTARFTTIQWLDSTKDFGKIVEGEKLQVTFRFANTGNMPLVISRVQASCGCTVAEQPEAPIAPGGRGEIRAVFNSQGHTGFNHKTLFVSANTRGSQDHSLQFVVEVQKKNS